MRLPRPLRTSFPCGLFLMCLVATAHAAPAVRLSEFLAAPARDWDGSGTFSSRDDEWIEIINGGATNVDLSSYLITDGDSLPRYGFSGTLEPGAVRLVTGAMSTAWERATGHPVFGLSLGNTGDRVMLWRVVGADTVWVDDYVYRSHECAADRAVGRSPDGSEWRLEDGLNPYTGTALPPGTGCNPTPGTPNDCGPTPVVRESWGRLKQRFR